MGIGEKIDDAISMLKDLKIAGQRINGCIAGSCMINGEFDTWDEVPDVDVFVYSPEWMIALACRLYDNGWKFNTPGDEWKFKRCLDFGVSNKAPVNTLKLTREDDIIINISYKRYKKTLADVLASFDMSIIMIGYDLKRQVLIDMREGMGMDGGKTPSSKVMAVPNPLRTQDCDMYEVSMWVRQFDRVIKYWNRGYDTRPMARFYIELIDGVLAKGKLFNTEKAENAYDDFVNTYQPLKDSMVKWLEDKED